MILVVICQGLLNRWTSQLDLGCTTGGVTFNLNNATKNHSIFVKLYIVNAVGENLANLESCPIDSLLEDHVPIRDPPSKGSSGKQKTPL